MPPKACGGRARPGPEGAGSAGEGGALGAGHFLFRRQEEPRAAGAAAGGAAAAAAPPPSPLLSGSARFFSARFPRTPRRF